MSLTAAAAGEAESSLVAEGESPIRRLTSSVITPIETDNPSLRRDLTASVGDGAAFGVMVGIGETYLPAFVLAVGLGEVFSGLIASIPVLIGSVLQLITPWGVQRLGSHRRWVIACAATQGCCFLPLMVCAWHGHISGWLAMAIASLYWGAGLATAPAWNTWQGTVVPRPIRANFFAGRSRLQQITTLIGFVAGGLSLQWGRSAGDPTLVFAGLFAVAAACRALSTTCLWLQSEPVPLPPGLRTLTIGEQWRKFTTGTTGRLMMFAVAMQAGVWVAGPYFNPYMLKVLNFSYAGYATLLGVSFVAKFTMLPLWGQVAHKFGAMRLLWIGTLGVVPLSLGWNVSSNYVWLLSLQVLAGAAWGAYELAIFLLFFETIPERERTSVLTWYNLFNSVALVFGSAIGAGLLQLGGVTPESYNWVYTASMVMRAWPLLLLWRLPRIDVAAAETPLRPLSIDPAAGAMDHPVLPGLPDQTRMRGEPSPIPRPHARSA